MSTKYNGKNTVLMPSKDLKNQNKSKILRVKTLIFKVLKPKL